MVDYWEILKSAEGDEVSAKVPKRYVSLPRLMSLESALVDVARGFCPLNAEEEKRITADSIRVGFATFSRAVIAFLGLCERRLPVVSSCSWAAVCYIPRLMGFVAAGGRV